MNIINGLTAKLLVLALVASGSAFAQDADDDFSEFQVTVTKEVKYVAPALPQPEEQGYSVEAKVAAATSSVLALGSIVCFNKPACRNTFGRGISNIKKMVVNTVARWVLPTLMQATGIDPLESSDPELRIRAQKLFNPKDHDSDVPAVRLEQMDGRTAAAT